MTQFETLIIEKLSISFADEKLPKKDEFFGQAKYWREVDPSKINDLAFFDSSLGEGLLGMNDENIMYLVPRIMEFTVRHPTKVDEDSISYVLASIASILRLSRHSKNNRNIVLSEDQTSAISEWLKWLKFNSQELTFENIGKNEDYIRIHTADVSFLDKLIESIIKHPL